MFEVKTGQVTEFGEDVLLQCPQCGYGGNQEKARAHFPPYAEEAIEPLKEIETPAFQFERVRPVNYLRSAIEQIRGRPVDPKKKLERELENAVENEDYERAARLRDRIRELP